MMFLCHACREPRLRIVETLELGGDDTWDERQPRILRCACGYVAIGASRRGSMDGECAAPLGYAGVVEAAGVLIRERKIDAARALLDRMSTSFRISG